MAEHTIFSKIISGEIPANTVFENERILAFHDIAPQAKVHLLVIPKVATYDNVVDLAANDPELLTEMVATAQQLANEHGKGEFRLVFNTGASAGQTVFHVHAHVLIDDLEEQSLSDS